MKRFLMMLLLIPMLVMPAYGTFTKEELKLFDEETAVYEQRNFNNSTALQTRHRRGNVITTTVNGDVVQVMTQSPDGSVTIIERPDLSYVFKVIFDQPIFELPDGSYAQGKQFAVDEDDTILDESDIFVKVEKDGFMSTFTYTIMGETGVSSNVTKYRNNSRLPISAEQIQIKEEVTTSYTLFTRLRGNQ